MKFVKRFWWLFVIGLLVGGAWMWWSNSVSARDRDENTYTVKREDLVETLSLSGEIDAKEKADVKFQTSGMLAWVGVKEGDYVKKYQSLASLDKRELQNSMSQLLNLYMKERWDFEQDVDNNKDWETRGMTDAMRDAVKRTLQKNQFDLNNAVLDVEAKNLAVKFATIWSPIEGIVTHIDTPNPGVNITAATAVFSVINPKSLYFSATADQTEVINFRSGMNGKIVFESFPELEIDAMVESISFVPKEGETGTVYELKMVLNTAQIGEDSLKMGMTGDANFITKDKKDVLAVPEAYVEKSKDKYYVIKLTGTVKERVEVVTGETIEGMVEIKEGLNEGETIYYQP